ncbi:MAG: PDZ domain-containing protein, partial [Phaeodactylibacter sp.]|nr:PDZ domain-containing protein [Phaeodactylibacter sp.]
GRPGAKAGLESGDIIIKIGDTEVKDIYGYMEGLGNFKTGDKTTVVVKRGEEILEKEVEF